MRVYTYTHINDVNKKEFGKLRIEIYPTNGRVRYNEKWREVFEERFTKWLEANYPGEFRPDFDREEKRGQYC